MKNFNLIEMAKAMKEHKLRHMWRYVAMMALLLTLVCGNVWGADQVLKTVDFSTSAWSSATFTANATTVVDDVTASSGSSSSKPTISISSGKFTMSGNMSSGKNCVGFQVSGIQYGTLIIEVYSDASTVTRCNYTVKDGGSSFSTSDAGNGTSSTAGEPIIVTGLTKTSAYVYVGRQGSSYTQFSKIIVKTPNPTGKTYAESTFYTTYASSSKTNAQLISSASFPENFFPIFAGASALNDKPTSTPTVTTPYDFSGVSTSSKSYILQTAENNVLLLNNVANVKSVRFYGDGNGSSGNISVNVTKQSGSGSTFSVSNISFTSTKTILEHSTGDLTGKSGYDANTFYNYKFTFSKKFHIWGVYVEAIVAAKDYTVTAVTSTGTNTYGTVAAEASSLDAGETTTITATPAAGYQVTNWAVSGTGASVSPSGASNSKTTTLTMGTENATVTATFGPKSYTVTLNNQSATTDGTENVTTTYNANTNLTSAITCPTKTSKVFAGYFTATNGGGVQLIDAAGNWIASAGGGSTYLDGSKNWKYDNDLTLYACWMEYASTFDIQAWVQSNIDDTKTYTTYTILGTNKLIYSLGGSSALDNSNKSSYEGLKMKNSGDYVMFLVQANSALKLYFGYTGTDPKKSINGGAEANMGVSSTGTETANQEVDLGTQTYDRLVKVRTVNGNSVVLQKIEITAVEETCTGAWSFHSKNSSSEWRDPICMELDGDGDFYISEETAINVGDVSYKVGYQGVDEAKTTETDWQWMPMGPSRNWTVGAHPTASNAGGALGYFYIHSTYTDNNRYIGFFPSSYMLRQGSGESWSNTTFNPASSAYGETVWTTPVQKYTASNAADYMYTALGTGNGGAVGCAMSTAMRPIYLKLHSDWKASSPKFYIYYFKNGTDKNGWSGLMQAVSGTGGDDLVGWIPEGDWDRVQFVRFNPGDAVASWDGNVWNSTYAITLDSERNYYVLEAQGNGGALDWYGHWDLYHNGFYRIWVDNASTNFALHYVPQYVLEYDNNGGSGSIDPQSVALDADPNTVTVKAVTGFTAPEGKHFVNWNTAPGGGGTSYDPSDSYSLTADATLYAQWAWNTYDVSTSLTQVSVKTGATGTDAATHGTAYTVTLQGETGYNLPATVTVMRCSTNITASCSWTQGTGVLNIPAAQVTGNISITASGVAQEYSITYKDQGDVAFSGTHADGYPTSHTYGTATTLKGATKTGYNFGGWFGNSSCTGDPTASIGATSITANITLYAKWTANSYSVAVTLTDSKATQESGDTGDNAATHGSDYVATFEAVSGYELPSDVIVYIGESQATKDDEYTWSISDGTGTLTINGDEILDDITITVTATSTCSTPADPDGLAAGSISSSGVTFTITDDESPASYDIYYSTSSTAPTGSTEASTTATSKTPTVSGLTASTTYYAWVRSVCDEDNKSDWVALTGSTFTTSAAPATYYLFTPTNASVSMAHTGTLSGVFYTGQSVSNQSGTISTIEYSKGIKFGGQLSSLGYTNAYFLKYDVRSTKSVFTVAATGGSFIVYQVSDGGTSTYTTYDVTSATTNTTFTITSSAIKTIYIGATGGNTNVKILQIKVEESGTIYKRAGEIGYSVSFVDGRLGGANGNDVPLDGMTIHQAQNYTPASSDYIKLSTNNTDYISFTTTAACQLSVTTNASSKAYYVASAKNGTTNETSATGTSTFNLAAGTWYINPKTSSVYVTALSFSAAASTYTVSVAANPSDYGSVSASSVSSVASGTTLSTSTNTLSVGATNVTATAKSATAEYTYSFNNWTKNDGTALPSTVTADLSVYANFTRSANSYILTWNTNGGSDLDCDGCTSGSTAYGASITAPNDPTLSNYTFDGWKTNNDGTGTTAGSTMPAATTTYYAAWKQTVTLKTGAQGSGADQTPYVYINGTGVSDFTPHTASGYTLQGYYTAGSGGVKVLNADGTFAAANVTDYITSSKWSRTGAAPTLFAQWVASEDCRTLKYVWKVTGNFCDDQSTATSAVSMISENDYFTLSGTGYIQESGKSLNLQNTQNNYFLLTAKTGYEIKSICFYGKVQDSSVDYTTDGSSWSALASTKTDGDKYYTFDDIDASAFGIKLTAATPEGVWIRNMVIEVCAAGGTTYNVTYNGNDETSGDEPTDASSPYAYGTTVTVLGNTGSLEKTNYTFAGWTTNDDGTGSSYVADNTFSITANTTLYAKWTQAVTFDANTANHGSTGGSATAVWNATGLTGITHATPASGYKLAGYYTAATSGTKVLNSDGSFADDNITDWIDDGKWVQNDDDEPLLYAQYEASGSIKWNLQVNSADAPIVTSSKNSSYTQISTSNMTNLDSIGLNITASKKSELTSLISTPDTKGDDCMYVTFKVATGYKFTPSLIKAIIQPVGNGEHKAVEFSLADESSHTLASASATKCDGTEKGKKTTVTLAGDGTYFTGTVTLKIFVYKHADGTNSTAQYRLGTPIQIDGEIESTCTMPSYGSVSYSQTEYVQPASASAISVVGASGDPSYQWKYNSTGDRTSGTNCGTEASVTPSTESTGTLYYWCELTNACGTVKTPAVAITVSESKSDAPSIAWTDPASTPNYGGGGYTLRATVNDDSWDGSASDLTITAPAGIRIYNTTTGTDGSSMKYIEVKFDVQTAFDRETYSSNIPFTVSADATTSYNAISADHNVSYSACSGGGGSATEELMPVDDSHMDNSTWKGGWVYDGIGMMRYGHGSSDVAPGTKNANLVELTYKMADDDVDTYYKSSANHFGFYTEKAITGIRLYVHTTNDEVTVSGVYVANSAYSTGTPSTGSVSFTAEYNDDNESLRSGTHSGSAWVDITFASEVAAGKYGQINLSSNVRIAGMAFISASGSGATLTTTLAFATTGTIAKTQSAANFTNAASVTAYSETLGAITYSSSNTDCATVDSKTGEVTITASGASDQSTTITATLAASGCYKGATTTYTITVEGVTCTVNHGTLASDVTTKCSTADATLTLTGFDSGATVQWYKGESTIGNGATYAITTEGTTSTMVTKEVGTYSVMVTKDECSGRSNSITISNYSAEVAATKIVDKWYIKNGRVTPDIALWTLNEGTHLDSVTWSTTNATGLTIADFYESDGVVYLSGKEPNTNESSDAEYTLTLRVKDECENKTLLNTSAKQITLIHQKNTDKHVLAFVVTGTEKGGFTEGITSAQTTGVDLYNEIAKNFDVQATNIYSTDDEQKLKEYYSQFDILCITDYPNTGKTGTNKKSYVDAIGSLIDIRPILTMEAWVSGLTNWKSKGISGTPKSPTTRQYSMLLQCKDHEIFSGTNPTTVGSGDETMYRIDMVDKTQEEYVTLDATYGAGAHAEKSGYEYGSKPALQGFTYDASMSSLLPIGRIDDGAGNDLEVGVERQAVMEARLLVLGINGYAMERLDDDGQTIVINALKYLMKKNAEDISDCSNYFVGGAEGDPYSWKNLDNWSGSSLPDRTQEVRIVAPCVISDTIARASSVKIVTGGTYSHGTKTANGSLTINPTGSLIVEGKIYAATAPNFFEQRTTEPENLIVKADADHTGTLIFDNEDGDTQATIEMYSPSHWEVVAGKYVKYWSYVGMPIKDVHIPDYFYGAFTYYFNEAKGWEKRFDNDIMQPFEGIGLSMQEGHKETFYGTMVSTENTDITITNHTGYGDGDNLIGNSWTAPIQIANFDAEDFGSCWATVYIFNTGKGGNTYVNANADNDGAAKAGQWLGVPIGVAGLPEYTGLKVIPAMNAFLVHDTESSSTTLHLDYDKLVRDDATTNSQINEKMRAPSRHPRKKKDVDGLMRIRVVGEKTNTDVWMLQDARFSEGFDNGWEARYNPCDDRSAQLYARSKVGVMSFIALPDLDGTVLGFAPSRDGNDYTFTFQYRGEDEYYLNDLKLQQSVLIDADNNYAFTYEKGDTNRFYVSRTPLAPQTPTGVDNASGATQSTKAIKVIYNGKLYIIRSGRVYSAEGILVK